MQEQVCYGKIQHFVMTRCKEKSSCIRHRVLHLARKLKTVHLVPSASHITALHDCFTSCPLIAIYCRLCPSVCQLVPPVNPSLTAPPPLLPPAPHKHNPSLTALPLPAPPHHQSYSQLQHQASLLAHLMPHLLTLLQLHPFLQHQASPHPEVTLQLFLVIWLQSTNSVAYTLQTSYPLCSGAAPGPVASSLAPVVPTSVAAVHTTAQPSLTAAPVAPASLSVLPPVAPAGASEANRSPVSEEFTDDDMSSTAEDIGAQRKQCKHPASCILCLQLMHARIIYLCICLRSCDCEHVVSVAHDTHHLHINMSPLCMYQYLCTTAVCCRFMAAYTISCTMLVHCILFPTFLHHRFADVIQLMKEPSRLWLHEDPVCKCMLLCGSPLTNATCALKCMFAYLTPLNCMFVQPSPTLAKSRSCARGSAPSSRAPKIKPKEEH